MRRFEPAPQSGRESNKSALLTEIGLNDMDVMELGQGDGFPKMGSTIEHKELGTMRS